MALILLMDDDPVGTYLLEERSDGQRFLWRISEGEPADEALEPALLWPGPLRSRTALA